MNENIENNVEPLQGDDGISDADDFTAGNSTVATPDGSSEPVTGFNSDGDSSSPDVWNSNDGDFVYSYDTGSCNCSDTVCAEILQQEIQHTEQLSAINGCLVLIFAFLIMEWTEKKINVMMKRFVNRRR